MTLGDIYYKSTYKGMSKGARSFSKGAWRFYWPRDGKGLSEEEAHFLNEHNNETPTAIMIRSEQIKYWEQEINEFSSFSNNSMIFNKLNNAIYGTWADISNIDISQFSQVFEKIMEELNVLTTKRANIMNNPTIQNSSNPITALENLTKDFEELINTIKLEKCTPQKLEWAFNAVELRIKQIKSFLKTGCQDIDGKEESMYSAVLQILGYKLEHDGITFFQNVLPSNLKVVGSGQMRTSVINIMGEQILKGGRSQEAKNDMLVFDIENELLDNINVNYEIRTSNQIKSYTCTLKEFLNKMENTNKNETIYLSAPDYKTLLQNAVAGVQSKLASKGGISSYGHYSLNEAMATSQEGVSGRTLFLLLKLKNTFNAHIYASSVYYDAYFNFELAKVLNYIVGEKNNVMLTKDGFQTTYDFVLKRFHEGYYFKAGASVSLLHPDKRVSISFRK